VERGKRDNEETNQGFINGELVMRLRFTLTHAIEGSIVISEPDGWKDATIGFERHADFHSLVEFFKSSFMSYGSNGTEDGGRDWVLNIEKNYGVDEDIELLVEIDPNDTEEYETIYTGQISLNLLVENLDEDHMAQLVFTQKSFWTKFVSRFQNKVNIKSTLSESGEAVTAASEIDLPLPSQVINKNFNGEFLYNTHFWANPGGVTNLDYLQIDTPNVLLDEVQNKFVLANSNSTTKPVQLFSFVENGEYQIDLQFSISDLGAFDAVSYPGAVLGAVDDIVEIYVQINEDTPIALTKTNVLITDFPFYLNDGTTEVNCLDKFNYNSLSTDSYYTKYTYSDLLKVRRGDGIKIWADCNIDRLEFIKRRNIAILGRNGESHLRDFSVNGENSVPAGFFPGEFGAPIFLNGYFYMGSWSPVGNLFPLAVPGEAGNYWDISEDGSIQGVPVNKGDIIMNLVGSPGQTVANWYINAKSLTEGLFNYAESFITVLASTISEDTTTKAFLTHDVMSAITDRITDEPNLFYSEYIGNTYTSRAYGSEGCGSLLANAKGLHIRGYDLTAKPFFKSAQDWWQGINPIHNLGLGYEKLSGVDVIRVERKEYFYDDSATSVLLSNVRKIKRSYDQEHQFNQIEIGYEKWQSQAASGTGTPSGIDDPQTKRTFNSRFKKVGKKLTIFSKWVAASLTLETTRRIGNLKSTNYTYDDETFVIALKSNGDGTFTPELDENFTTLTNLSNSDTRYNSRLTPGRNLLRWMNYVSGCLQSYLSSTFKFSSGEGNFDMTSQMNTSCLGDDELVDEKGDFAIGTDYLFLPMAYEIEHYLTWEQYVSIRDNKNLAIGVSQTAADHKKMFIKNLDYKPATGEMRAKLWAKEVLDISTTDFTADTPSGYESGYDDPYYE
jgi:hypothetical protein